MKAKQKRISFFICLYIAAFVLAIIFKFEHYPFTWAHMFSRASTEKNSYSIALLDLAELDRGIDVHHKDGTSSRLNYRDLNIPLRLESVVDGYSGMYRLLIDLCDESDQNFSLFPTTYQLHRKYRPRKVVKTILYGLNKTMGYHSEDPKFIVGLGVRRGMLKFYDLDKKMRFEQTEKTVPLSCTHLFKRQHRYEHFEKLFD